MKSRRQLVALKYLVARSKDGNDIAKRILWALIDGSHGLRESVAISLVADREGFSASEIFEAGMKTSDFLSCNGSTHIDQILAAMGTPFRVSVHYGDFDPTRPGKTLDCDGMFAGLASWEGATFPPGSLKQGMPMRYTFWLARENYDRHAKLLHANRETLLAIDLSRPGLHLETEATTASH